MSEERFERMDQKFTAIDQRFDRVDQRLGAVDERLDGLKTRMDTRFEELDRHMHVLHEDVLERIAATQASDAPSRAEMRQGFAELKEMISGRLDPLEAAVRHHSLEIERLKQGRR